MASETKFVGYDKDNERVYQMPDGRYQPADDEKGAEMLWNLHGGYLSETYERLYGPVTVQVSK